jgi:toxin CptA
MLRVALIPSSSLAVVLAIAHAAAGATLVPLDLPIWTKAALAIAVAASFVHALLRHALLRSPRSLHAIELGEEHEAAVQTRDGNWHEAQVLGTTYVSPLLTVINLRVRGCMLARHMLIVSDNADPDLYRQLRVWLRWGYRQAHARHDRDAAHDRAAANANLRS